MLEDANLKLGDVVSDMMGVSARAMLAALLEGQENPEVLAQLAQGRMRSKLDALQRALRGQMRETHRVLLRLHLQHIDGLDAMLQTLQHAIDQRLPPFDPDDSWARLDTIPGVGSTTAQVIVAEVGIDMSRFADADHLASWSGLAPGKNQSAGRNYSAKIAPGNRHLPTAFFGQVELLSSLCLTDTVCVLLYR